MSTPVQEGDIAPDFSAPRDGGETMSLRDFAGNPLVLYFYPRDDTPGCTTEAIDFTARIGAFNAAGATVIGVSRDTVTKHEKFIAKHNLGIPLISDEDGSICEAYGTWVEKSMYGKTSMGIERATFVIDGTGKLARVWRKVKVKGHVEEVLEAVEAL